MKFVEDKIEYIHQEPGFEGGLKMAELAARTCYKSENLIKDDARKEIEQLPSVTPKENTGWIPVSEKLPEELEPVNITWINHNPESYYADNKIIIKELMYADLFKTNSLAMLKRKERDIRKRIK